MINNCDPNIDQWNHNSHFGYNCAALVEGNEKAVVPITPQ